MCMSTSAEAKPASPSSPANNSSGNALRDPSWLKLDVCPDFMLHSCQRNEESCPLAHPSSSINIVEGTVTCCFDFIKGRCQRTNCRYYHPPPLIKDQLIMAGKMHAQQTKSRSKELSASTPDYHAYAPNEGTPYNPLFYSIPCCEQVEICREFMRGRCHRIPEECRFYHPEQHTVVDSQNMVVVCPNWAVTGTCKMNRCLYGHPLSHHKLQKVPLFNPFPAYAMGNSYMQAHPMPMSSFPYHPMMYLSFRYPNMYPNMASSPVHPNQIPQIMPTNYHQPYSSSTLWTPPPGVFFGADYVSSAELQLSANGISAKMDKKSGIKMEKESSLNHAVDNDIVNNQD